jgi:hypothetical protein
MAFFFVALSTTGVFRRKGTTAVLRSSYSLCGPAQMDFFQRGNCMEKNGAKNFLDPGIGEGKANAVCAPRRLRQLRVVEVLHTLCLKSRLRSTAESKCATIIATIPIDGENATPSFFQFSHVGNPTRKSWRVWRQRIGFRHRRPQGSSERDSDAGQGLSVSLLVIGCLKRQCIDQYSLVTKRH